jgi:HAE1 family hydrophobic/amphiphilic exporter-1
MTGWRACRSPPASAAAATWSCSPAAGRHARGRQGRRPCSRQATSLRVAPGFTSGNERREPSCAFPDGRSAIRSRWRCCSSPLVLAGLFPTSALPIKNYPEHRVPGGDGDGHRNGAAPSEMESQVSRPVENAWPAFPTSRPSPRRSPRARRRQSIQFTSAGTSRRPPTTSAPRSTQSATCCPRHRPADGVERLEFDDQPIITYAVSAPACRDRPLVVHRQHDIVAHAAGPAGRGQVGGSAASTARSTSSSIPTRGWPPRASPPRRSNTPGPGQRRRAGRPGHHRRPRADAAGAGRRRHRRSDPQSVDPGAGGRFVRLSDVADVGDGLGRGARLRPARRPPRWSASRSPRPSSPARSRTEDGVDAAPSMASSREHPGLTIHKIVSQVDQTRGSFSATLHTLLEGMALAALVVWLFLRDWRATASPRWPCRCR